MGLHSLPIDPRSAAAARRVLRDLLSDHAVLPGGDAAGTTHTPDQATETAVLAVSELVSNAVRHAGHVLELSVSVRDGILHVAVIDDATGEPVVRAPDDLSIGGRGLHIVDQVADRWGVDRRDGRKAVWFELHIRR